MRAKELGEQEKVKGERVKHPDDQTRNGKNDDRATIRASEFRGIQGLTHNQLRPAADEVLSGVARKDNRAPSGMDLIVTNMRKGRLVKINSIWFD